MIEQMFTIFLCQIFILNFDRKACNMTCIPGIRNMLNLFYDPDKF
jgi:hypothetical protein